MLTINFMLSLVTISSFLIIAESVRQPITTKKSKLCGNNLCDEVLFKSRVKRVIRVSSDPNFLILSENAVVDVVAVKFSDRPDIMEGKLADGTRGFLYGSALDAGPYVEFLRAAIDEKKEMQMISQDPSDVGDKRIVGILHSEIDFVRDYNAKASIYASEQGLPQPPLLPIPETNQAGHGHSHGGHGHSHGGHGHSHGDHGHSHGGHGHSHGEDGHSHSEKTEPAEVKTTPPPPTPAPVVTETETKTEKKPEENPKDGAKQEVNLNNVLTTPPTGSSNDNSQLSMDEEIERLVKLETERMMQNKNLDLNNNQIVQEENVEKINIEVTMSPLELKATPDVTPPTINEETITTTPSPIEMEAVPVIPTTTAPMIEPEVLTTPAPIVQMEKLPEKIEEPVVEETTTVAPIVQELPTVAPVIQESTTVAPAVVEDSKPEPIVETLPEDLTRTEAPKAADEQKAIDEEFEKWQADQKKKEENVKPYEDSFQRFKDLDRNLTNEMPKVSSGIIEFIRNSFGLGNITDASVVFYVNITFVLASFVVFIIVHTLSTSSDPDKFDRMAYFNLTTKHKELEMQLKAKHAEIENLSRNGVQMQANAANDQEIVALRHQVQQLSNDIQIVQSQKAEFEMHCNQWRDSSNEKQVEIERLGGVIDELERKLEKASLGGQDSVRELDSIRAQLTESHQVVLARQQELVELRQEKDGAVNRLDELSQEIRGLNYQIEQLKESLEDREVELRKTMEDNASLTDIIQQYEKNKDEGGSAAESGGSGWSDFGDNDEFEAESKEQKTPDASQSGISAKEMEDIQSKYKKYGEDMEEMALLKQKLVEVEKELTKYKSLHEKEEKLKMEKETKLKNAEKDVVDARKKIEELEAEKKESADRMNELLKVLNASMTKSADVDKTVATLREEGIAKEKQLMESEVACRKKDDKIREVESDLKRLQREYTKLETKSFHDVMQLKKKLDDLQTSQLLTGTQMPLAPRDMFNSSDIGGSDDRRVGMGSPLDEPIWDEPEYPPSQQIPQENYFSSDSMGGPKRRSSRRIDHRLGETSPGEEKSKSKKDATHRRRSRSHGRNTQMYPDPFSAGYLPGSSDSSFMSHGFLPLSGRHSKSGQLHYSSGGSNGGRSPPPEMPLLSAIPPPGIRRMPAKRIDSSFHEK